MRVPRYVWISFSAVLLLVGAVALWLSAMERALVDPRHEFALAERPAFLTEELALAMARETLARDGCVILRPRSGRRARHTADRCDEVAGAVATSAAEFCNAPARYSDEMVLHFMQPVRTLDFVAPSPRSPIGVFDPQPCSMSKGR